MDAYLKDIEKAYLIIVEVKKSNQEIKDLYIYKFVLIISSKKLGILYC